MLNDPVNLLDPEGKLAINLVGAVTGAIIGGITAASTGGDVFGGALVGFPPDL